MLKVYVAGSLFNEAEVAQRKKEGEILRATFPQLDIFNPIDQPFNENKQSLPTPEEIYDGDTKAVEDCDIFIADLTNEDAGVMVELGIAIKSHTKIIIKLFLNDNFSLAVKLLIDHRLLCFYVFSFINRRDVPSLF